ncbi:mechanosensitive ion channel [Candidatus Woesearchaeota archaeon]|nr:mechanosensitive ion channel [Candidatus Woesearchaeota archaeon]
MAEDRVLIGKVTLENFLIFIFVFLLTIVLGNIIYLFIKRLLEQKISKAKAKTLGRLIQYVFIFTGLYLGLYYILKLDFTALTASLGIFSIAVAFSSQQIIQNFIAGIIISAERRIKLEDWIETANTGICSVKEIKLTHTLLRSVNGRLYYLPNSVLLSSYIINYTKAGFVEIPIQLVIPNSYDVEKIMDKAIEIAVRHPRILPNVSRHEKPIINNLLKLPHIKLLFEEKLDKKMFKPRVYITDISDPKITLSVRVWILEIDKKDEIVSEYLDTLYKDAIKPLVAK